MERTATGTFTGEKEYFTTPLGENHEFREGSGPYEYLMGALTKTSSISSHPFR